MVAIGGEEPMKSEEKILVLVRLRPMSKKEIDNNEGLDWECINGKTIVFRNNLQERSVTHNFDRVFSGDCSTREVYGEGTREIALSVVSGINSSILAYGQTSSGKTYTMSGITEYAVADIYAYIMKHEERAFVIKFSAMEIYNEAVRDLLRTDNTPLRVRDDPEKGAFVENLTEEILRDWEHFKELLSICKAQRRIGETSLNESSSRSHQIVRLTVESSIRENLGKENAAALSASLNFVDLAGSERTSQTSSDGERQKEGCHINSSLFTLGNVIRKLSKGRQGHVSYRDSKLTRILQPCLGGNARTAMICTLSPARVHAEQSRNTLFFASCAKEVSTNAKVNIVMSDKALLKRLQGEVARLETELRVPTPSLSCDCAELVLKKDQKIEKLEMEVRDLTNQRDLAEARVEELQIIIENYQTSRESAKKDTSPQWQHQCDETAESSKDEIFDSVTISTGDDEASSPLMVVGSNGIEAFESSSPYDKDTTNSKFGNQMSFEQWDLSESRTEESLLEVQDYQSSRQLGERGNSSHWPDQCIEAAEFSEDENSTLTVHNYGNEVFDSSSPNGEEECAIAKYREQWDLAAFQGERDSSPQSVGTGESSYDEISKPATLSTSNENESFKSSSYSGSEEAPNSRLRNQSLTRSSKFRLSNDLIVPSLSSETSTNMRNTRLPPQLSTVLSFSPFATGFLDEVDSSHSTNSSSAPEENIPSVQKFVAGLKASVKLEYEKITANSQDTKQKTEKTDTSWAVVFVRLQKQILELWQICNISLVYRTYFFLLFKGEATDSIYMEIELRRLNFLKEAFSKGNHASTGGQTLTLESSVDALRRERDMLTRLMNKKFSRSERNILYEKWAINLGSKQRRRQFVNLLWSNKRDLKHIMESAEVVGKLIDFSQQGASLKEMFGLSFGSLGTGRNRMSFAWN